MNSPADDLLGPALDTFKAAYLLSATGLADWLGIREQDIPELARYACPDPNSIEFHDDIKRIFEETGADVAMLRRIVRYFKDRR